MERRSLIAAAAGAAVLVLTGCGEKKAAEQKVITIGATAGTSEEVCEQVAKVLAKQGITLQVKTFGDYVSVDIALAQGDIDMNSFQHTPYLNNFNAKHKTDLVPLANTYLAPLAGYSKKYKNVKDVLNGAQITVPNDPTNEGRALKELERLGWIKLKNSDKISGLTVLDIVENPKNVKIKELEAAQLPRSLEDTDVAVINSGYAISAGLNSKRDSIFIESAENNPYMNIIAVRKGDEKKPAYLKVVEAYHSPEVKKFIDEKYNSAVITSW